VRIRRGPATVTGERTRLRRGPLLDEKREGRGGAGIREPGDCTSAHHKTRPGRGPREGGLHGQGSREGSLPIWPALIAPTLFAVLFDNGALLVPLLGGASGTQNCVHELFHD
jgi:hypothetical protein